MIDIHTHLLPGVDDGSPDFKTSIDLIKKQVEIGVTDIFVTPHYFKFRKYVSTYEENQEIFNKLNQLVKDMKLNVNLYLGNEIYYDKDTLSNLSKNLVSTLGDSKYVLVEFSLFSEDEDIPEAINNLTAKGYIPIIAHPERYPYMLNIEAYSYLKRMGARIQINSSSLLGLYGRKTKKFVLNLIKNDLVDFVASDIHDFRMSNLLEAFELVKKHCSEDKANRIFNNKAILN